MLANSYIVRAIVVAVSIGDDGQSGEKILVSENRSGAHSVLGVPDGQAVTEQIFGRSMHLELDLQLPVPSVNRLQDRKKKPDTS